jgi:hypothetical protein
MHKATNFLRAVFLVIPLLLAGNVFAVVYDDYTPEVTARVARIGFLRGEAQIRRADSQDWERAAQNLPIVEGDQLATASGSRLEIQFNSQTYLRLAENSTLKIVTLKDEGIAVSLPEGTLSLRVLSFDKAQSFFEIDAPQTTIAVQKAGMYRIDAGNKNNTEVRVAVTDSGEARIYSENSGFMLRSGRSARLYLDGNFAGEWETGDASRYADEFDQWALDRDSTIAKRLRNANYDKYYDRDIYGAEDLSEYGEWIYTKKYGYVWKPFRDTTSRYADWSPYRYGHWRWVPPYGWTWVNDEPWGWATYHHGRWIWDDGYWVWTPYGQKRLRRSWWSPGLVVVTYSGSLICWYPLPYDYGYYDYNSYYRHHRGRRNNNTTIINNNTTVIVNNPTNPTQPPINQPEFTNEQRAERLRTPTLGRIPPGSVMSVDASGFGRETKGYLPAPTTTAQTVITKTPETIDSPPILPDMKDLNGKVSRDILIERPQIITKEENVKIRTGASERKDTGSMDEKLRQTRIYGNRPPVQENPTQSETKTVTNGEDRSDRNETRKTGAVIRPERPRDGGGDSTVKTPRDTPVFTPPNDSSEDRKEERKPTRIRRDDENQSPPIYVPPTPREEKPRYDPPREEKPRYDPPPREEKPRYDPPPPREEKPRNDPPPKREEPRQEERKPSQPPLSEKKEDKDGR